MVRVVCSAVVAGRGLGLVVVVVVGRGLGLVVVCSLGWCGGRL